MKDKSMNGPKRSGIFLGHGLLVAHLVLWGMVHFEGGFQELRAQAPLAEEGVTVERSVPYVTRGERQLLADIYRPQMALEADPGPRFPTVLMIHGGAWFSGNKAHVTAHARFLAARGYVVVAINYRLAPQDPFPAQLEDCRAALNWITSGQVAGADRSRLAAYGYSAGAHLACLLATTADQERQVDSSAAKGTEGTDPMGGGEKAGDAPPGGPVLRAVVAGGTPCEFSWIPPESTRLAFWLGGSRRDLPDAYRAASPLEHVGSTIPPIFFFHGDRDGVVPLSSPEQMMARLSEHQIPCLLHVVENGDHLSTFLATSPREAAVQFLDPIMKPARESR